MRRKVNAKCLVTREVTVIVTVIAVIAEGHDWIVWTSSSVGL